MAVLQLQLRHLSLPLPQLLRLRAELLQFRSQLQLLLPEELIQARRVGQETWDRPPGWGKRLLRLGAGWGDFNHWEVQSWVYISLYVIL